MAGEFMRIGLPANFTINNEFGHLRIVRKWFHYKYIITAVFVLFWCGFLIFWYAAALFAARESLNSGTIVMMLFPILHVTVGIGLAYYTLMGFFNKTVIEVDYDSLTITHGPLPTWGNKKISSRSLKQLYAKEDGYTRRGSVMSYGIHAITDDQRNIKLLGGLDTSEQALFIEQEIERVLNLQDRPVKGEIR